MGAAKPHTIIFDSDVLCTNGSFKTDTLLVTLKNLRQAGIKLVVAFDFKGSITLSYLFKGVASSQIAKYKDDALLQAMPLCRDEWPGFYVICSSTSGFVQTAQQKGISHARVGAVNGSEVEDILCSLFGEKIRGSFQGQPDGRGKLGAVHSTGELDIQTIQERKGWRVAVRKLGRLLHSSHKTDGAAPQKKRMAG